MCTADLKTKVEELVAEAIRSAFGDDWMKPGDEDLSCVKTTGQLSVRRWYTDDGTGPWVWYSVSLGTLVLEAGIGHQLSGGKGYHPGGEDSVVGAKWHTQYSV